MNLIEQLRETADLDAAEGVAPEVVKMQRAAADEIKRLTAERDAAISDGLNALVHVEQLTADNAALAGEMLTERVFNRLVEWLREDPIRPATEAFTAGIERQIAYALEASVIPEVKRLKEENALLAAQVVATEEYQDIASVALRKAWQMGQTYWQQADSEYVSQHRKSDETHKKFQHLIEETRSALSLDLSAAEAIMKDREAKWWALVMGAAASLEDAANCLTDVDAKKAAEGAAKHYRLAANRRAHCMCESCKDGKAHDSDCSVHNEPAMPKGQCDCRLANERRLVK